MLFHVGIPSLYPGNVQEILDLRPARLPDVASGGRVDGHEDRHQRRRRRLGTANVSPERLNFVTPDLEFDGQLFTPRMNLGMNVRVEGLEMEQSLYTRRLEVVKRYARANNLNNVVFP